MAKVTMLTCLRLEPNEIRAAVVDAASGEVVRRETLSPGFPVLSGGGSVASPQKLAEFLRQQFAIRQLPTDVKAAIGLKFLDIKLLSLPALPPGEREAVIQDEAARESIFSYSGEPVAVAYRLFTTSSHSNSGLTVLTVTTPKEVTRSIIDLFYEAELRLTSLEPSIAGIQRFTGKHMEGNPSNPAVLFVSTSEAELYIFNENAPPLFWRHLSAGVTNIERLGNDTTTSLSHYNSRAGAEAQVEMVYQIGLELEQPLSPGPELRRVHSEIWPDLAGLGLTDNKNPVLSFYQEEDTKQSDGLTLFTLVGGFLIMLALLANTFLGWRLYNAHQHINRLRGAVREEQKSLELEKKQATSLAKETASFDIVKVDELMLKIRAAIPAGLRLETMDINPLGKTLEITGVCRKPEILDRFIQELSIYQETAALKSVLSQVKRSDDLVIYTFQLTITMEGSGHE